VTWRDVGERARSRVVGRYFAQWPEIEGPADRLLFDVAVRARSQAVPLTNLDASWSIPRGRILGAHVGDVYAVFPPGPVENTTEVGDARVIEVGPTESMVE
jgi:hypothetical protein